MITSAEATARPIANVQVGLHSTGTRGGFLLPSACVRQSSRQYPGLFALVRRLRLLVLSTREPAKLRDGLIPIGVTLMSAGSHTEPGGYTGAGKDNLHHTVRGRVVELAAGSSEWEADPARPTNATGQFDIADERSSADVARQISALGYEPVWKDWDAALTA